MKSFLDIIKEFQESHAFALGAQAYHTKETNPFEENTLAYQDWIEGFSEAEFLANL